MIVLLSAPQGAGDAVQRQRLSSPMFGPVENTSHTARPTPSWRLMKGRSASGWRTTRRSARAERSRSLPEAARASVDSGGSAGQPLPEGGGFHKLRPLGRRG